MSELCQDVVREIQDKLLPTVGTCVAYNKERTSSCSGLFCSLAVPAHLLSYPLHGQNALRTVWAASLTHAVLCRHHSNILSIHQSIWPSHFLVNLPYFILFLPFQNNFHASSSFWGSFLSHLLGKYLFVQERITSNTLLGWKFWRFKCSARIPVWNSEGQEFHS